MFAADLAGVHAQGQRRLLVVGLQYRMPVFRPGGLEGIDQPLWVCSAQRFAGGQLLFQRRFLALGAPSIRH